MNVQVITLTTEQLETLLQQAAQRGATIALEQVSTDPFQNYGDWMTSKEVAELLRVHPATVRSRMHDGLIPQGKRIGKSYYWQTEEIKEWYNQNKTDDTRRV